MDSELQKLLEQQRYVATQLTQSRESLSNIDSPRDAHTYAVSNIDLERSRETLIRKRISQTRSQLPQTAKSLGQDFVATFREYAQQNHVNGPNAIARDALSFADWLSKNSSVARWMSQLAKWESLPLVPLCKPIGIKIVRVNYDFRRPIHPNTEPPRRRMLWCSVRCFRWTRVYAIRVAPF
jgi:hypothetical protein